MPKKRKLARDAITVGGKVISLEGYLSKKPRAQQPEPVKSPTPPPPPPQPKEPKKDARHDPERTKNDTHETPPGDPAFLDTRRQLPLWRYQDEIRDVLRRQDVLVVVGETGSGKSTQVPQFLYREAWCRRRTVRVGDKQEAVGGMIAVTQPRRVAATTLAHRVSREMGTPLANHDRGLVGYSVRFDHNVPQGTRVKFLTEGMLLHELLRDPNLRQYSAVVVDEIHERSVDVDLLSGFLQQILHGDRAGRGGVPLKVVVMSATADVERISRFFGGEKEEEKKADVLRIEGRQFPVDIVHAPQAVPDLQDALLKAIFRIHLHEPLPGDVLAFLTGQEEIESAQRLLEEHAATLASNVPRLKVLPLFGQLSIEAQHEAFQPVRAAFTRKIVLATNIAETSVTVPGIRYVVDGGKAKVKQFRARLGMESLLAKPISRSSAVQRAGRAGREGPGRCFRLYTEDTFASLPPADQPEILRNDVLGAVLAMKARGVDDVLAFPLMDRPPVDAVAKALVHLHLLGAIGSDGAITDAGRRMAFFPVPAPLARVLLAAADARFDCVAEVVDVVACIASGDDVFRPLQPEDEAHDAVEDRRKELYRREGDLLTYLATMQLYAAEPPANRAAWCRDRRISARAMRQAVNVRRQLRSLCAREGMLESHDEPQPFVPTPPDRAETVVRCFLQGFALRTAVLAPDGAYVTTRGKHNVAIHPSSVLHGHKREAVMFLEHVFTQKSYAKKVSAIQANWIAEALEDV